MYTYVDVPDFAREPLSLSGIVLHVDPAILSAPRDAFTNLLPVVPTARRDFARTDRALAFVRLYQNGENAVHPVDVNARIEDAAGQSVLNDAASVSSDRFGVDRSADNQVDLPIDRLQPGEYLLTIEPRKANTPRDAECDSGWAANPNRARRTQSLRFENTATLPWRMRCDGCRNGLSSA